MNEYDQEYFEYNLFQSRREYTTITRRLHRGIVSNASCGKHVASAAPFGYDKYKLPDQLGYSLKINDKESKIVQMIFNLYCNGKGIQFICNRLNAMGIVPRRSNTWGKSTIGHILTNPVYIGKIKYTDKATIKKVVNGEVIRVKNENAKIIYVDGLHKPIIDNKIFNKVQEIKKNNLSSRVKVDYSIKNPMASILRCGICGRTMHRITYNTRNDVRICCKNCHKNVGTNIKYVEDKLIKSLELLLHNYKLQLSEENNSNTQLQLEINLQSQENINHEIIKINSQINKTYDLLEQGIYDKNIFFERMNTLKSKLDELDTHLKNLLLEKEKIEKETNNKKFIVPKIENVINTYYSTDDINLKNKLLKSVLQKVEYTKVNPKDKDDFKLVLFPKLY